MKFPILLIGFFILSSSLRAVAPRPCTLMVRYQGQMLPVVRVKGSTPYVLVNGKEKSVSSNPEYNLQDAPTFGDGYVEASSGRQSLGGTVEWAALDLPSSNPNAPRSWSTWFSPKLVSKLPLTDGFAAVVTYSDESVSSSTAAVSPAVIMVHGLPDLPAGKAVEVKFAGAGNNTRISSRLYFIQIFDGKGHEVMTSDIHYAWEYYALRDRARLAMAVKKYLEKFPGTDHDAVPAIMPKPIFAAGSPPPGPGLSAILTVTETGQVSEVEIAGTQDPELTKTLTATLEGWLFLPKLKAGQPVPVKVQIPLKF